MSIWGIRADKGDLDLAADQRREILPAHEIEMQGSPTLAHFALLERLDLPPVD